MNDYERLKEENIIPCSRLMKRLLTSDDKRRQQQMKSLQSDHCQISDDVHKCCIYLVDGPAPFLMLQL